MNYKIELTTTHAYYTINLLVIILVIFLKNSQVD
jgi:hypothetical protein